MKSTFVLLVIAGVALSAPVKDEAPVTLLKYENTNDGLGSYSFSFESSDGTFRREEGVLKNADDPEKAYILVTGSYSFIAPDGEHYTVNYTADENGFHPEGAHLPGSPPLVPKLDVRFNDRRLI